MKTVLIVDDSALIRKILRDIINQTEGFSVIGYAIEGHDAVKKVESLNPDIVTLDIHMPGLNGLHVMQRIMKTNPKPVIVISSHTPKDSNLTLQTLEEGAIDFLAKPNNIHIAENYIKFRDELVSLLKQSSIAKPHEFLVSKTKVMHQFKKPSRKVLVIGASTGGPSTIHKLFSALPGNLSFPILVVQHMPTGFTKAFAERLDKISDFNVKEAEHGEEIKDNTAYISRADIHMEVLDDNGKLLIQLVDKPKEKYVKPSLDVLAKSVAPIYRHNAIMVVLTGMGSDGTEGARAIKNHGGVVIAESKDSCVLYGMPKSVIENNLADLVVNINKMPVSIVQKIDF